MAKIRIPYGRTLDHTLDPRKKKLVSLQQLVAICRLVVVVEVGEEEEGVEVQLQPRVQVP